MLARSRGIKGRHKGQRGFILGAGSSITQQDLSALAGEVVLAVSNTFVHPLYGAIQPKYHLVPPMLASHGAIYDESRFVDWLQAMEAATGSAEMVFHIGDRAMIERHQLFRNRTIHWVDYFPWGGTKLAEIDPAHIPSIWSVSELAITLALYLDFQEIYLLGIDHDWFNGILVYFFDHTTQHRLKPSQDKLGHIDAEMQMRRHADIFKKYKALNALRRNIYNANSNKKTYVDTFPLVDFDSLFQDHPAPRSPS